MPDYAAMYFRLFNAVTDALEQMDEGDVSAAATTLIRAQQAAEEMYISQKSREFKNPTDFGCFF